MWHQPWTMKEGFLIGGGLIIVGLALELSVGPVAWEAFAWPANGFVLAGFLTIIAIIFLLRRRLYTCRFIGTYQAAIPTLVYAVVLTIIMGLTRQKTNGTWLNDMLSFWPFVLMYVYMAVILGVVILRRLVHLTSWRRDIPFLLNHLGLFIAMTTATLGNADIQRLKMITVTGESEWRALTQEGAVREMPLAIELKRFIMETYDDGSPKRFASEIQILTKSGKNIQTIVDVNKPVEVEGWKIYQYGYDTQMGAKSQISILELVSDPWLPLVYTGIYMMLAGAVCMFIIGGRKRV
ncbi:MAG: cytochrome c biogenesis protein ResB [Prevotella sp.]|nr:cytochrome c biogenesis protein ResB [Prevotella sp.]